MKVSNAPAYCSDPDGRVQRCRSFDNGKADRATVHVQTIAEGTEVQRESSTRIARNMQEVNVMAEESRAHAHPTATAIDGLRKLAGHLRSVVAGLKTG